MNDLKCGLWAVLRFIRGLLVIVLLVVGAALLRLLLKGFV